MQSSLGSNLRAQLGSDAILPIVVVYDVFSASLAAPSYHRNLWKTKRNYG